MDFNSTICGGFVGLFFQEFFFKPQGQTVIMNIEQL